ncbi:conserved hypothetical protein [Trichinella spiralis]|uniref:hypothetical protein n=1 Tax=Trichinella spiralis TaxID=6334 RepID=UPI0001EFDC3D|nr:conserved hypothetical protein [Trichinella spiralis]
MSKKFQRSRSTNVGQQQHRRSASDQLSGTMQRSNAKRLNALYTDRSPDDSSFICKQQIDCAYPDCKKEPLDLNVSGVGARLRNLRLLIQSIQSFYKVICRRTLLPCPSISKYVQQRAGLVGQVDRS